MTSDEFKAALTGAFVRDPIAAIVTIADELLPGWPTGFAPPGPGDVTRMYAANRLSLLGKYPRDQELRQALAAFAVDFAERLDAAARAATEAARAAQNKLAPIAAIVPFGDPNSPLRSPIDPIAAERRYREILDFDSTLAEMAAGRPDFFQGCWFAQTYLMLGCDLSGEVDKKRDARQVTAQCAAWLDECGYGDVLISLPQLIVAAIAAGAKIERDPRPSPWSTFFSLKPKVGLGFAPRVVRAR